MKFYLVGGAVRDMQMNIESNDYDFVVVGASPDDFKDWECVGKDFPVFLEPTYGWEVALARVERKVGAGYTGFEADWKGVTLEQDLERRDLTINAMAIEVDFHKSVEMAVPVCTGDVIDPFDGLVDMKYKELQPVSGAFSEDPVRVLRAARFLARYDDFRPSYALIANCAELDQSGELAHLVPERVWQETVKALGEKNPRKYFEMLIRFDNFPFVEPFIKMLYTVENNDYHQEANVFEHTMMVLDHASEQWNDPEINFACLMHDIGKPNMYKHFGKGHGHDKEGVHLIEEFCKQWKVPARYRNLARLTSEFHQKIHVVMGRNDDGWAKPKSIMKLFEETAAKSHPERFLKILKACESDAKGRIGIAAHEEYLQRPHLEECLNAVLDLDTKGITKSMVESGKPGPLIGEAIRVARINEIRKVQNNWKTRYDINP